MMETTQGEEDGPDVDIDIELHPLMSSSDSNKQLENSHPIQYDTSHKHLFMILASLWIGGLFVALGQLLEFKRMFFCTFGGS